MSCPACGLSIDEHPANRCLDAWVATTVFERQVKYVPPEELPPAGKIDGVPILRKHGVWLLDDYDPAQDGITVSLWDVPASHMPRYSTDRAAIWEIAEKLQCLHADEGIRTEICIQTDMDKWQCLVGMEGWAAIDVEAVGDTPELAVCQAALGAVETEHG